MFTLQAITAFQNKLLSTGCRGMVEALGEPGLPGNTFSAPAIAKHIHELRQERQVSKSGDDSILMLADGTAWCARAVT